MSHCLNACNWTQQTLDTATHKARQSEMVKRQQTELCQGQQLTVDAVSRGNHQKRPHTQVKHAKPKQQQSGPQKQGKFKWCGHDIHKRRDCPTKNSKCNHCQVLFHFAAVCQKKLHLNEIDQSAGDIDDLSMGIISLNNVDSPATADVDINGLYSDGMWCNRSWSSLTQVMACHLISEFQKRVPLAARHEPEGVQNRQPNTLYVFEHNT